MSTPQPREIVEAAISLLNEMESKAAKIRDQLLSAEELDDFQFTLDDLLAWTETVESDAQLLDLAKAIFRAVKAEPALRAELLGAADPVSANEEDDERHLSQKALQESGKPSTDHYQQRVGVTNTIRTQIKSIIEKLLPKEGQRAAG